MNSKILMILLLVVANLSAYARDINITGTVTDASGGEPLVGVSVIVKGNTRGVITDLDGKYSIAADEQATLQFSYVGCNTRNVDIKGRTTINVELEPSQIALEQVVVVGYGSQKKVNLTGSVASVTIDKDITSR